MVATDTATSTYTDALGRSLRGAWVNHGFHAILRAAELPSVPFHGLRHSAATAVIASAVWSADRTDIDAMVGRAPVDPARVKPASGCPAPNRTAAGSLVDWRAPGG